MYEQPVQVEIELFLYQSLYVVLWLELQAVLSSSERQVLGDVRRIQQKEIIVINQAYFV